MLVKQGVPETVKNKQIVIRKGIIYILQYISFWTGKFIQMSISLIMKFSPMNIERSDMSVCRWDVVCVWVMYTCVVPMRHKTKLIFSWLLSEDKLLCVRHVFGGPQKNWLNAEYLYILGGMSSQTVVNSTYSLLTWPTYH